MEPTANRSKRSIRCVGRPKESVTYRAAAESLCIGIGTLYTQFKRIRDRKPSRAMAIRRTQLEFRNQEAVDRADSRSHSLISIKRHNSLKRKGLKIRYAK